jgi:hypothetical protein
VGLGWPAGAQRCRLLAFSLRPGLRCRGLRRPFLTLALLPPERVVKVQGQASDQRAPTCAGSRPAIHAGPRRAA